ncbi:hypothetical protein V6N13_068348 [Hibiscus sabdariffa]
MLDLPRKGLQSTAPSVEKQVTIKGHAREKLVKRPTSSPSETSPFVFIPTPGLASHPTTQQSCPTQQPGSVMTVRLMPTSQEHCSVDQSLSQSSTLTQNVQENNNNEGLRKRPRMV